MNRHIVYAGQIPLDTDLLNVAKDAYVGLAKLAEAIIGTAPVLVGFAVAPTSPASMTVNIGTGQIYSQQTLDASAYSDLGTDATAIVKQGLMLTSTTPSIGTFPAPSTAGQSINYLVQVGYLSEDTGSTVLGYYNSANPNVALNGPSNSGASQATIRADMAVVSVLPGSAGTTGSQPTPSPSSGCVGAYVVTVAYGQTSIGSGNISVYSNASFLGNQPSGFSLQGVAALASPAFTGAPTAPTQAPGDSSTKLANMAAVQSAINTLPFISSISSTATLLAANSGTVYEISGSPTITLPAKAAGLFYRLICSASGCTLQTPDSAPIYVGASSVGPLTIPAGGAATFFCDGTDWIAQNYSGFSNTQAASDNSIRTATTAYADRAAQAASGGYAADTGSTNSLDITLSPAPANLAALTGLPLRVKVANTVTGTCSLNVNGLGASGIVHGDGTNVGAGEAPAGAIITVSYNGTQFVLQSVSFLPATAAALESLISGSSGKLQLGAYIVYWGTDSSTVGSGTTNINSVSWAAFPNAVDFFIAIPVTAQGSFCVGATHTSVAGGNISYANGSTGTLNMVVTWIALGH